MKIFRNINKEKTIQAADAAESSDTTIKKEKVEKGDKKVKKEKISAPGWLEDIRYGRSLSVDFFKRNAWLLILIVVLTISLIGVRYKTKTKMSEIKSLQRELSRAESEKLQEKSEYMSLIRETEILRLVKEKGLGLELQEQPPYEVNEATEQNETSE